MIETLRHDFGVPAGLSDHTLDPVTPPAAATAFGAAVVEKTFTLDKDMEGSDYESALEPKELDWMVSAIRNTERALGDGVNTVQSVESELYGKARRAVHSTTDIAAVEELTEQNITDLRSDERDPGLEAKFYRELLGQTATVDIERSSGIEWSDVEGYVFDPSPPAPPDGELPSSFLRGRTQGTASVVQDSRGCHRRCPF